MHSLLMTDNNCLLMGGLQNYVVEVDLNTVQEAQKVREACQNPIVYSRPRDQKNNHQATSAFIVSCVFDSSLSKFPGWQYCDKPIDTSSADTRLAK